MKPVDKRRGFTLLELLIAISVFSVIGLASYQMLQSVIDSHEKVRSSSEGFTALNLAFSIIQRDFNQFAPRPVRDRYGEPLPPILFANEDMAVEFTRAGWSNPVERPRSNLQRVAYSIDYDTGELTRHFWTVLDRAEDTEPVSRVLLEDVESFSVTGFAGQEDEAGFELDESTAAAPLAVEVTIATGSQGEIRRLFQLVEPWAAFSSGSTIEGEGDGQGTGEADGEAGNGSDETGSPREETDRGETQ